jgi:hypothetical protein
MTRLPSGVAVSAIRIAGVDVTDTGFNVKPNENVSGIEIELTSHPTTISGLMTDGHGTPTKNGAVIVFSRDEQKWGALSSRFINATKPDQDGAFKITGLPPGDYYAVAIDGIDPGDGDDLDLLKRFSAQATTLSLSDGETKTLTLRTTGT